MKKELEKTYNPKIVEERLYQAWMDKKYFHAEVDKTKVPYTIVIPPPNITGQLHMGHAMDNTLQDILTRTKRMQGFNALWVPGTDHASIATEVKIVEKMAEEGLTKSEIGREEFLKRAWKWKEQYGGHIVKQLYKLGCSCDWDRERFTMDEGLSNAVTEVFIKLYNKGYIYLGEKLINWCPNCKTTISEAEVEHQEKEDYLYYLKYPFKDNPSDGLVFATTRPETIPGDVGVAVNPKDERYSQYIGKSIIVPIVNREGAVIADESIEIEFGTGVLKITPAHSADDFAIAERNNLPKINVLNDDGTLNEAAGKFAGMSAMDAREAIVDEFKALGLFIKKEKLNHSVGSHERCGHVIEPLIKMQWFVKMEELAKPAIEVNKSGELRFIPDRFSKIYLHWLENIKDWCISRQLWWGHRIPAYYCQGCGHIVVDRKMPNECPKCSHLEFVQDEDVLDTWFSSALWPFSTLGWPDKTEELNHFYPTSCLVTGYDIIFFWVVRMVFSGLEQMGQAPFKDVLIHGLVRDAQGRKMSKSLGNGIDPLDVIDKYGADALRLTLTTGVAPGSDCRFYWERVESNRNFLNKIWNATRFVLMNFDEEMPKAELGDLTPTDKWILSKMNTLIKEVTESLDKYDFGIAVQKAYDFIWDEYCDWYIEMVKTRLYNQEDPTREAALWTLRHVLYNALKLLHPFIPFITEEIFMTIQNTEDTIVTSSWPQYREDLAFIKEEKEIGLLKEAIKGIRNLRSEMNVAPSKKVTVWVISEDEETRQIFNEGKAFFATLAYAKDVEIGQTKEIVDEDALPVIISGANIYIPFAELVDIEKEMERLTREKVRLEKEVARVEQKLSNEGFVKKAPAHVIEEEKVKQEKYQEMLVRVQNQILALKTK